MRKALCQDLPRKIGDSVEIPTTEANHLISVLRLKPGDTIEILDGNGKSAQATIFYKAKSLHAELVSEPKGNPHLQSMPLHLCMAILKGDAMEWVIEKSVELGVRSLIPFQSEFTVVDLRKKGPEAFQDRWQKIADQALKQCGRLERMIVQLPVDFETVLSSPRPLFWLDESLAYETNHSNWNENHLFAGVQAFDLSQPTAEAELLIGPEGGFSPNEKNRLMQTSKKEIKRSHAGAAILRAETAAIFGVSVFTCRTKK